MIYLLHILQKGICYAYKIYYLLSLGLRTGAFSECSINVWSHYLYLGANV